MSGEVGLEIVRLVGWCVRARVRACVCVCAHSHMRVCVF